MKEAVLGWNPYIYPTKRDLSIPPATLFMILMIDDFGEVELTAGTAKVALDGESVTSVVVFLAAPGEEDGVKRSRERERPRRRLIRSACRMAGYCEMNIWI